MHTSHRSFWNLAGALMLVVDCARAQPIALQPGQKIWEFQTGGPVSAPAIATDGTVYYRSGTNTVYALDGQTGTKEWGFQATNDALDFFPVVAPDGTVYVATVNASRGTVYALDGATGLEKSRFAQFYGAPAVNTDGTLFLRKWVEGPVRITQRLPSGTWSINALDSPLGPNKWELNGNS